MADSKLNIIIVGKDQASKSIGGIQRALGGLRNAALLGGAAVAGAGVAIGGIAAKLALDAMPIEGIRNAFVGLSSDFEGGSAAMLAAMQESSLGMISQRDLMQQFNLAAQLVSKDFAETLPDAMGYLGKVSAATGEDMGFMMDSLVRGVGRLSPMILDNLGIQVDLNSAYEVWSEKMGIAVEDMTKTEQQAALMDQVMLKLKDNTAAMPEVTDNAATKMAQLGAKFQDVKDALGERLLPVLTTVISKLLEWADQYGPVVVEWVQNKFIPALNDMWVFIRDNVIPIIGEIVLWLQENIPKAIETVKQFWEDTLKPTLDALWVFIRDNVIPIIEDLFDWLSVQTPDAFKTVKSFWEDTLRPALNEIWQYIQDNVLPRIEDIVLWLGEKIPEAFKLVKQFWDDTLHPVFTALWEFIRDNIIPIISDVCVWLSETLTGAFQAVVNFWNNTLKPALDGIKQIFENIRDAIGWVIEKAETLITTLGRIKMPKLDLPDISIPDWLIPGSPTPFEMGLRGIADAMGAVRMEMAALAGFPSVQLAGGSVSGGAGGNTYQFNLSASYAYQERESLAADVRLLQMLYG